MTKNFSQITPELMQSLLVTKFPSLKIRAVHTDGSIHGTATKVKVTLDADGDGPRTMWVKAGWEESSEILRKVGIFSREPRVYAELLPELGLEVPDFYGASWDDEAMDGIVLLEDLGEREAHFNSPLDPLSPKAVAALLSALAKMHGMTHGPEWLDGHDWLRPLFWDTQEPDSYLSDVSAVPTLEKFSPCRAVPPCQKLHAMPSASPLLSGEPQLLAVRTLSTACCMVTPISVTATVCQMEALGCLTGNASGAAAGPMMWLTNMPSFQPEEFNAAVASRFAHAMLDHGLFGDGTFEEL